ncbi:MAG: bifunctional 3-deoxy-7-phosphoheptulonate synthase/chorismate mutase [Myxococcales bacterium]|nr:bifunctional 3-deoxy-7-phosphoheptulonate synthase/chorismate mutase [Myxococcales bacterium]
MTAVTPIPKPTPRKTPPELDALRAEVEQVNFELLALLSRRGSLVTEIQRVKAREDIPTFLPDREQKMLADLVERNPGPFPSAAIRRLFHEIFRASVDLMERERDRVLKVSRSFRREDLVVQVGERAIGGAPVVIAGPCSVESEEQMDLVARALREHGIAFLRGGVFKPRSSPYSFQGLGARGLEILARTAHRHGLRTVTEVMDPRSVGIVAERADVLQIGSRNMHNYDLLREVGRTRKPILLKRGLSATIEEFLWSAEYIISEGNENIVLCERGIRTFENATRNTLDVSAVALLRQQSFLPVIVDVSHAAGRKDILAALARAGLAAGANGIMVEIHPCPASARSDSHQQLDFAEFAVFLDEVAPLLTARAGAASRPGRTPTEPA